MNMLKNLNCLLIFYLYLTMLNRIMAYRQLGGQAKGVQGWGVHGSHTIVAGGQARTVGGQAKAVGGQARTAKYENKRQVGPLHANKLFPRTRCDICSYKQLGGQEKKALYHKHYSSKSVREIQGVESEPGDYFCPTCKKVHSSTQPRLKICLSSSTLHEFWAPRKEDITYGGDSEHIDYITIPGASIIDLIEAWKIEYYEEKRGMDVFIVAGLNNVKDGDDPQTIMRDYDHLVQMVHHQAYKYHQNVHNSCAIATLIYPPQLCWFPDQGSCPPDFSCHLEDIRWINFQIERLNDERGIKVPNFTTFGLRVGNRTTKDTYGNITVRHTTTHRYEHWREDEFRWMLHLDDQRRIKMGKQVGRYFLHETSQ